MGYTVLEGQQLFTAFNFLLKIYVLESIGVGAAIIFGIAFILRLKYSLACILYCPNSFLSHNTAARSAYNILGNRYTRILMCLGRRTYI
jgi:hypothetical protein